MVFADGYTELVVVAKVQVTGFHVSTRSRAQFGISDVIKEHKKEEDNERKKEGK